jgi:hypothetical protein
LVTTIDLEDSDTLGQRTSESLREAGHDGAEIAALRAYGAVGGRVP